MQRFHALFLPCFTSKGAFNMKNTFKLFGTQSRILCAIALLVVIAFSMAACDPDLGGGGGSGNGGGNGNGSSNPGGPNSNDTANINAFESWLLSQPANTAETAYTYKLNVSSLATSGDTGGIAAVGAVGAVLTRARDRYVKLDLSGSTFTSIGNNAFSLCNNLVGVTLPNSVKSIGDNAFAFCSSLASVTIPNSVTSIGEGAFSYTGLTSVNIPNGIIGKDAFSMATSLASLTIGNNVTSIGEGAFDNCWSLGNITIPNSVTSIGERAFYSCGILFAGDFTTTFSLSIGTGITSFRGDAFKSCSKLTSVTFRGPINSSAFRYNIGNSTFLVSPFDGDLLDKFYSANLTTGTPGTYTRAKGDSVWTKQ
jgi:hypothetical protein